MAWEVRSNPPLQLAVWAICAALLAVAIYSVGHRGIKLRTTFPSQEMTINSSKETKEKEKKKIQAVQSELQPASSTPLACYLTSQRHHTAAAIVIATVMMQFRVPRQSPSATRNWGEY